jgi:hypothetical protein
MVVNFRARGISRGARKLARTPTIIIIKKKKMFAMYLTRFQQYHFGLDALLNKVFEPKIM